MDTIILQKQKAAFLELLKTLGFTPRRVIASEALYPAAREACIEFVHSMTTPISFKAHYLLPDDMAVIFGAEGDLEVVRLEKL
jgi:hypothetical protein